MSFVDDAPNKKKVQRICPAFLDLLGDELIAELDNNDNDGGDTNNDNYWKRVHLVFILRILSTRTSQELAGAVLEKHKEDERTELPYSAVTSAQLSERLNLFKDLLDSVTLGENHLLNRVAQAYELTALETRLLQFLVTCKIQSDSIISSLLPNTTRERCNTTDMEVLSTPGVIRYACGASPLELEDLLDEDHVLCKERILLLNQDEFGGSPTLQVSDEACRAFLGKDLSTEDKLKLSGTKLLEMLDGVEQSTSIPEEQGTKPRRNDVAARATIQDMLQSIDLEGNITPKSHEKETELITMSSDSGELVTAVDLEGLVEEATAEIPDTVEADSKEPRRYTCELDYLKDQFDLIIQKVLHSRQRIAQDLRNASVADSRPMWMRTENATPKISAGETTAQDPTCQTQD
jgi:hypothetical protein